MGSGGERDEQSIGETSSARERRYRSLRLEEVSGPEYWMLWCHCETTSSEEEDTETHETIEKSRTKTEAQRRNNNNPTGGALA